MEVVKDYPAPTPIPLPLIRTAGRLDGPAQTLTPFSCISFVRRMQP